MTQSTHAHPEEPNPSIFQQLKKAARLLDWFMVCGSSAFSCVFVLFRFVQSGRKDQQVRVTGIRTFIFKQLRAPREKCCPGTVALA